MVAVTNVDAQVETLRQRLAPAVAALDLELYDIELTGAGKARTLRVTVNGVDLDAITAVTQAVSPILDDAPELTGSFLLEVSSPGVERVLRTPAHYAGAIGETVSVKVRTDSGHASPARHARRRPATRALHHRGRRRTRGARVRRRHAGAHRVRVGTATAPRARQEGQGRGRREQRGDRMKNPEMLEALSALAIEKGISEEIMLEALANALVTAYKRMPDAAEEALVEIDVETGEIRVIAQELDEEGNVTREWDDTPADFGRIAAQTAKQVILQRIREAEREMKYEEYAGREGDIVTGIIQQTDARYTLLDLGRVEALLPQAEQVPGDRYDHGARMKAYIVEVRKTAKGPQIVVSRTHPGLVRRLFELEVPELVDGVVEIRAVAREPGHRTKLAVASNDSNVDPVGACVGARGMRVRQVVNELRGEKVDIVPYSADAPEFVMRALAPAKVREVRLHDDTGIAEVIVPDFQLSLAIGKEGQNARLAARLTGWRVDIKSETQLAEEESGARLRRRRVGRRPRRHAHVAAGRRWRGDQRGRSRLRDARRRRGPRTGGRSSSRSAPRRGARPPKPRPRPNQQQPRKPARPQQQPKPAPVDVVEES